MASTYTSDLRLNKQGSGDNNNTWGTIVNTQLDLLDDAITGLVTVNVTTGSDVTLSTANGTTDEARKMILKLSGTPIANINIIVPAVNKVYIIEGASFTGSYTVTVKTSSGIGVSFSSGECGVIACDSVNVLEIVRKTDPTPANTLVMFYGTVASALLAYPGWVFCDGTNGTPDLRDRFIVGARQDSGGSAMTNITGTLTQSGGSVTTSSNGGESLTTGGTSLTIAQLPSHYFTLPNTQPTTGPGGYPSIAGRSTNMSSDGTNVTNTLGSGAAHDHTVTTSNHTHTAVPPYFALVYLMKV